MFIPLLLVISFFCLVEGQLRPPFKTVIKTAPTFFPTFSDDTVCGFPGESISIDPERRKTRDIINRNYKFRPHQCGGPGWTRAYYLNMNNLKSKCPTNWTLHNEARACGRKTDRLFGCDPLVIPVSNMKYSTVCGRIYAYQYGYASGFEGSFLILLTHGGSGSIHHIWTFVAALDETSSNDYFETSCSCINTTNTKISKPSSFTGGDDDYFCDTGAHTFEAFRLYKEDSLWDGEGCRGVSTCCSFNNPPWFFKELKYSTTDDMVLHLCGRDYIRNDDTLVYLVEMYIR